MPPRKRARSSPGSSSSSASDAAPLVELDGGKPFPSCLTHIAFRNLKVHTWGFLKPTVSTIVDNCAVFLDPGVSDVIKAGVSFTPEHESAALAKVLPNVDTYLQSFRDAYAYRQAGDNSLGGE